MQELHELVRLHHEVQLFSLQLHVKQLAGEKLLPLLEKMDPLDRSDLKKKTNILSLCYVYHNITVHVTHKIIIGPNVRPKGQKVTSASRPNGSSRWFLSLVAIA